MRDEDVGASVVVVIPDRDAHAVAMRAQPGGVGDIGVLQVARAVRIDHEVASIQPGGTGVLLCAGAGGGGEHTALQHQDVELCVVVVVENGHARADDLRVVELAGPSVEVLESDPARLRGVDEQVLRRRRPVRRASVPVGVTGAKGSCGDDQNGQASEPHLENMGLGFVLQFIGTGPGRSASREAAALPHRGTGAGCQRIAATSIRPRSNRPGGSQNRFAEGRLFRIAISTRGSHGRP